MGIGQNSPVEVLLYLAAAPLLHHGRLADWAGVNPETLLAEVWAPRARDPDNRDSGQTWLGKNLGRLQDEIDRAAGGLNAEIVVKRRGGLRLSEEVVLSDVAAFMAAVERLELAMAPSRSERRRRLLGCGSPGSCRAWPASQKRPDRKSNSIAGQASHTGSAARRLEALGRDAAMLLARAYSDAGHHDEALAKYDLLLAEDPLDRRAREGLLLAAAGTRDVVRLEQAWQQVPACLGGDDDTDARTLYERLRREVLGADSLGGTRTGVWAVAGRDDPETSGR